LQSFATTSSINIDTQRFYFLQSKGNVQERGQHIFYERLRAVHRSNPLEFSEFLLHLRGLNPNRLLRAVAQALDEAAENIEDFECDTSDVETLIAYLNCIKAHEIQFIHQLTAQLS
jgi:hypothetical protein